MFFLGQFLCKKTKKRAKNWREKKILSNVKNDIIDQYFLKIRSNEQLIKNYSRHYSRSKSETREVNVSDYSEIRKLKIVSLRMLVTVKQDNKKTRDSFLCVCF